jgi:alpha/beta superfamily hydrolase
MVLPYTLRLAGNLIPQGNLNSQANPTPEANHTCSITHGPHSISHGREGRRVLMMVVWCVDDGGRVCLPVCVSAGGRGAGIYEGSYVNGKKSGHGCFTWIDGSRYEVLNPKPKP